MSHRDNHPPTYPHHTVTKTTYNDTPSENYFARLYEKAAPSGTIHLNSYEDELEEYRQPVYYARAPPPPRGDRSPPMGTSTRVVKERVITEEREPGDRVVEGKGEVDSKEMEGKKEERDRGFVRDVAGKGAGAIWKALGGGAR